MIAIDVLQCLPDKASASALQHWFDRFSALLGRPFLLVTEGGSVTLDSF
jgi:hypothetical protein